MILVINPGKKNIRLDPFTFCLTKFTSEESERERSKKGKEKVQPKNMPKSIDSSSRSTWSGREKNVQKVSQGPSKASASLILSRVTRVTCKVNFGGKLYQIVLYPFNEPKSTESKARSEKGKSILIQSRFNDATVQFGMNKIPPVELQTRPSSIYRDEAHVKLNSHQREG